MVLMRVMLTRRPTPPLPGHFAPHAAKGTLPFDGSLRIPEDVWADMGPRAQLLARDAATLRKRLADVPLLMRASATMSEAVARSLGVTILHASSGTVELGVSDLPAVPAPIIDNPKGACWWRAGAHGTGCRCRDSAAAASMT